MDIYNPREGFNTLERMMHRLEAAVGSAELAMIEAEVASELFYSDDLLKQQIGLIQAAVKLLGTVIKTGEQLGEYCYARYGGE